MFIVSLNESLYEIGGYEEGDTQDYYGPDVDRLAAAVIAMNSEYMVSFIKSPDSHYEQGFFLDKDGGRQAVMYHGDITVPKFVA